jgi:hypothetical protein
MSYELGNGCECECEIGLLKVFFRNKMNKK